MGWARARLVSTKGENPKKSPPTKAAGDQRTHRSSSQHIDSADRAGATTSIRFRVATGPNSQVTGAKPTPRASEFGAMLMPRGTNSLGEKNGLWPWASA